MFRHQYEIYEYDAVERQEKARKRQRVEETQRPSHRRRRRKQQSDAI